MKCCTGNLLPLLQREGGRVKNFGKNTSEGPIWEKKKSIINSFLELPKLWELWVFPQPCSAGWDFPGSWKTREIQPPQEKGGDQTQRLWGETSGKGAFLSSSLQLRRWALLFGWVWAGTGVVSTTGFGVHHQPGQDAGQMWDWWPSPACRWCLGAKKAH